MKRVLRENGLSIVLTVLFITFLLGQTITGLYRYNDEQKSGQPAATYSEYLKSGEFLQATMENWESEFLQMGMYVLLTTFLYQKGSAESNKLDDRRGPARRPRPRFAMAGTPRRDHQSLLPLLADDRILRAVRDFDLAARGRWRETIQ